MIVPAAAEQAGLVEMDMGVDEAGQRQLAADIDLGRIAGKARLDSGDPATGLTPISTGVAEDRVRALRKIRSKAVRALMGTWFQDFAGFGSGKPSGRAAPGQLQIVCSFEAKLFKICACNLADRL